MFLVNGQGVIDFLVAIRGQPCIKRFLFVIVAWNGFREGSPSFSVRLLCHDVKRVAVRVYYRLYASGVVHRFSIFFVINSPYGIVVHVSGGGFQIVFFYFFQYRLYVTRRGSVVTRDSLANDNAIWASRTKANFPYSDVDFGTITIFRVRSLCRFVFWGANDFWRFNVSHSATSVIRVHLFCRDPIGFSFWRVMLRRWSPVFPQWDCQSI